MEDSDCKYCRHYDYTPNILGGITECRLCVKPLNTFWPNDPCEKFEFKTQQNNGSDQNTQRHER